MEIDARVLTGVQQWRDSLIDLTRRNRLLAYRPTKVSTLEFSSPEVDDIYKALIDDRRLKLVGTVPPKAGPADEASPDAEDLPSETPSLLAITSPGAPADAMSRRPREVGPRSKELFVERTQADVDRATIRLATNSRRELLDKGISTLYVAMGLLEWRDAHETYISPLLLLPVELTASGPKQPLRLQATDEDLVVNPALQLKLAEHGVILPSSSDIDSLLSEGRTPTEAFAAIEAALSSPASGAAAGLTWTVQEVAILATFMFAKEAMYRDLKENESAVAAHSLVTALAGVREEESNFSFEPLRDDDVDEMAPVEVAPLVLDADSSQRAAIAAAAAGRSFVLDGPPGTGKSQTIGNIIATALEAGKTVLFVSEKAVALDVVRSRLESRGLGPYLFELHSRNAVRSEVAARLSQALTLHPDPPATPAHVSRALAREYRERLSGYAAAMNEVREPLDRSLHDVIGALSHLSPTPPMPDAGIDPRLLSSDLLREAREHSIRLAHHWRIALQGERALWWGALPGPSPAFELRQALLAAQEVREEIASAQGAFEAAGFGSLDRLVPFTAMVRSWCRQPQGFDRTWLLRSADPTTLRKHASEVGDLLRGIALAERALEQSIGPRWEALQRHRWRFTPASSHSALPSPESSTASSTAFAISEVGRLQRLLTDAQTASDAVAQAAGLAAPRSVAEASRAVHLYRLVSEPLSLSPLWHGPSGAARARAAAGAIREAWRAEQEARDKALAWFTEEVLEADPARLETAFARYGQLSVFTSAYRQDKTRVTAVKRQDVKWRAAAGALGEAVAWLEARQARQAQEHEHAATLGESYVGEHSDWDLIDRKLSVATEAGAHAELVRDEARYLRLLASELPDPEAESLIRRATETATLLKDFDAEAILLPTGMRTSPFENIRSWCETQTTSLERTRDELIACRDWTGQDIDVRTATSVTTQLGAADHALGAFESAHAHLSEALGTSFKGRATDPDAIHAHISWLEEFLDSASVAGTTPATTQYSLDTLDALPAINGLEPAAVRLAETRETLLKRFSPMRQESIRKEFLRLQDWVELLEDFAGALDDREGWLDYQRVREALSDYGLGDVVTAAIREGLEASLLPAALEKSMLTRWIEFHLDSDARLARHATLSPNELQAAFAQVDRDLWKAAVPDLIRTLNAKRPRSSIGHASLIVREGEKKRKHIPIRQLIDEARDAVLALHPCFMMSPLAVSQYLPADLQFDLVIFDEASQVTPGDAINCIYRARSLIAAGDQRQLPPTSFFAAQAAEEDGEEEDVAADYESVLDLMKASGNFESLTLRWHYRSQHEHLIAFSNVSFYKSRLITFPGAAQDSADLGVKYFKVPGVYQRSAGQNNPVEAAAVADRVIHHFRTRPKESLGVVAFSVAQRDAIEAAIEKALDKHPEFRDRLGDDRQTAFFVKNLEAVQGDERDVIIFSVGYGPDEHGKISLTIPSLNRSGGERRLNVAVTRARRLVEVVASMSAGQMREPGSEGLRHLRRYLDYAERGPAALALELGSENLGTESPFEDAVVASIRSWGYDVQPQVGVAGYRIDIGVRHPSQPGTFMLGVECDGAMYHSSRTARDRDRLRHEVLTGLGWDVHHIWGTNWYRNRSAEEGKLRTRLQEASQRSANGRLVERATNDESVELEYTGVFLTDEPEWAVNYEECSVDPSGRWFDIAERTNARRLVSSVQKVVAIEAPIHEDQLIARIRSGWGQARATSRIRETIQAAIDIAGTKRDGAFLLPDDVTKTVRKPWLVERRIEHVHDSELALALLLSVRDAAGATREDLIRFTARVFGWRVTATVSERLGQLIDNLTADDNLLMENGAFKLGKPALDWLSVV